MTSESKRLNPSPSYELRPLGKNQNYNENGRQVLIRVPEYKNNRGKSKWLLLGLLVLLLMVSTLVAGYFLGLNQYKGQVPEVPDPEVEPPPSHSRLRVFQNGAVCTDAPQCSKIGSEVLKKNGSAVDAAIAAMFCNGIFNHQSMGLGGGFFMTVYIKNEDMAYSVVAREMAPLKASKDMYKGNGDAVRKGALSIAVPGELRGMWLAHKRWGVRAWSELVMPTVHHCRKGIKVSKVLYDAFLSAPYIKTVPQLRKVYYDDSRKAFHPPGSTINPHETLCNTLETIASEGGDALYNGSLARALFDDLQKAGSIITEEDLLQYTAKITEPTKVTISNGDTLYTPPLPSSGPLLAYIMNILSGYNFTSESIATTDQLIMTYHRIIEAFKYAYATRTWLGDPDFLDMTEFMKNVTSSSYATATRLQIDDARTSNKTEHYGADTAFRPDAGTAHISIIAPNGDAVSVTSSINYYFGSGIVSPTTGIVLNNVMDDFSIPGVVNYFGIPPSPSNFIEAGKRPFSSMGPSIIVSSSGNAKVVIGASGGTKITTATAMAITRMLSFGQSVKQAVDASRIHHQLIPMYIEYEYGIPKQVLEGLRAKGHGTLRYRDRGSIVCALYQNSTGIYANADFRKGGDVEGL